MLFRSRDLYGSTDMQSNPALSRDGYGIGRLDSLAREQSLNQAQTYGYAMGGPVSFADGGDTESETLGLPSLAPAENIDTGSSNKVLMQNIVNTMKPIKDMSGITSITPETDNQSVVSKVITNLKADPEYQPKNPIEEAIVKQFKGTDTTQQGLASLSAVPSRPMAPT